MFDHWIKKDQWYRICTQLRWGDCVLLCVGVIVSVACIGFSWTHHAATHVIVRSDGVVVADLNLKHDQQLPIQTPMGLTVIEIKHHRVRIVSDGGPKQYCVQQSWLHQAGQIALCLPSRVSVRLEGDTAAYETLAY